MFGIIENSDRIDQFFQTLDAFDVFCRPEMSRPRIGAEGLSAFGIQRVVKGDDVGGGTKLIRKTGADEDLTGDVLRQMDQIIIGGGL